MLTHGVGPMPTYSIGAMLHGEMLVVPHGVADTSIAVATVRWRDLVGATVAPS